MVLVRGWEGGGGPANRLPVPLPTVHIMAWPLAVLLSFSPQNTHTHADFVCVKLAAKQP